MTEMAISTTNRIHRRILINKAKELTRESIAKEETKKLESLKDKGQDENESVEKVTEEGEESQSSETTIICEPKPKRKTNSIQHLAKDMRDEEEEEGPYMKAIRQKVDFYAMSIIGKGKQMKESLGREEMDKKDEDEEPRSPLLFSEGEYETLNSREEDRQTDSEKEVSTDIEDNIIPDTDSDIQIVSEIANDVNRKLSFRQLFGSSSEEEQEEPKSEPKKLKQSKKKKLPKKMVQMKLSAWKKNTKSKIEVSKSKKFTTKMPQQKFTGLRINLIPKKKKVRRESEDDSDFNYQEYTEETEESESEQATSRGVKRKASDVESDDLYEDDNDEVIVKKKKPVKNPGCYKRPKIQCPVLQCGKTLAKSSTVLRNHYEAFHKLIPHDVRNEAIAIATKPSLPRKKDGTRNSDAGAKPDKRNRRKKCIYCSKEWSVSHLRGDHLKPNSRPRCRLIPTTELDELDTIQKKKNSPVRAEVV